MRPRVRYFFTSIRNLVTVSVLLGILYYRFEINLSEGLLVLKRSLCELLFLHILYSFVLWSSFEEWVSPEYNRASLHTKKSFPLRCLLWILKLQIYWLRSYLILQCFVVAIGLQPVKISFSLFFKSTGRLEIENRPDWWKYIFPRPDTSVFIC